MAVNTQYSNITNSERWLGINVTGRAGDGMIWISATDIVLVEQDESANTLTNIYYKSGTDTSTVQLTHAADATKVVPGEIMDAMWKLNTRQDIVKEEVITSKAVSAVKTGCSICPKTEKSQAVTTGGIDPKIPLVLLNVTGTKAYTLADSTEVGFTIKIIVTVAESTPAGTLTPTSTSGAYSTIAFDTLGQGVELTWTGAGWAVLGRSSGANATTNEVKTLPVLA